MSECESKTNLKFFVGGIPSDVKHRDLYDFFKTYGVVKRITIFNSNKGRKLFGFCFVKFKKTFGNELEDKEHVFNFHGRHLEIDPIVRRSNLKQSVQEKHSRRIFLQNIPREFTQEDLLRVFSKYGPIVNCFVIDRDSTVRLYEHEDDGRSLYKKTNYGYVIFQNKHDAESVIQKRFVILEDKSKIFVKRYCSTINRNNSDEGACADRCPSHESYPIKRNSLSATSAE